LNIIVVKTTQIATLYELICQGETGNSFKQTISE